MIISRISLRIARNICQHVTSHKLMKLAWVGASYTGVRCSMYMRMFHVFGSCLFILPGDSKRSSSQIPT